MNLPITSRVKRSPLLQTENEIATGSKVTPGKDKEIEVTETKKKDYVGAANDACSAEYIAKNGRAKCDEYKALPQSVKDDANTETITTTKIEPGEDKVVDVDLKRKQYQDVMEGPWEQRRILRQGRMVGRQKNRYKRKLEKYGTFDADGKFTQKKGLSQKQQRKSMQFQEGLARTESARERTDEGIASGKRPGSRIKRKEDRDATTGEFTDKEQVEMGARRQQKQAEIAAASGITTSQAAGAVNVSANPFSQSLDSAKAIAEEGLNYKSGGYTPFKMKGKSPVAKTLKGNQGKLPQHLQDAIKAAPESPAKLGPLAAIAGKAIIGALASKAAPGKMRSGFKMKGYGKK
jgi:hypothetical protein